MKSNINDTKLIASWFVNNCDFLTSKVVDEHEYNLKVIKLCALAYSYYGSKYKKALFKDGLEAWREGPVSNTIYAQLKSDDIICDGIDCKFNFTNDIQQILDLVNNVYSKFSDEALSNFTHGLEFWKNNYKEENGIPVQHIKISDDEIFDTFDKDDFEALEYFTSVFESKYVQIVEKVTVVLDQCLKTQFDTYYDLILEKCKELRKNNEYYLSILCDENGGIIFEI